MIWEVLCFEHILTPIAILKRGRVANGNIVNYRSVYIFGIRVLYWTIAT